MNITLWIVQGLLAVAALVHAWLFIVWPAALVEKLQQSTPTPKQEAVDVSPIDINFPAHQSRREVVDRYWAAFYAG